MLQVGDYILQEFLSRGRTVMHRSGKVYLKRAEKDEEKVQGFFVTGLAHCVWAISRERKKFPLNFRRKHADKASVKYSPCTCIASTEQNKSHGKVSL
jgi:hypothetical protein